jgi:uncharacterized DUF497 family protein
MDFRWNDWNLEHATKHGVTPEEAEQVVLDASPPFPESGGDDKFRVWGRTVFGRLLQVVYIEDPEGTTYIIHARPLTDQEKRRLRRRRK